MLEWFWGFSLVQLQRWVQRVRARRNAQQYCHPYLPRRFVPGLLRHRLRESATSCLVELCLWCRRIRDVLVITPKLISSPTICKGKIASDQANLVSHALPMSRYCRHSFHRLIVLSTSQCFWSLFIIVTEIDHSILIIFCFRISTFTEKDILTRLIRGLWVGGDVSTAAV